MAAFLDSHVRSMDDLALLTALIDAPSRWWDAALAARELGLTPRFARAALDRFASGNLLDIRVTDDVRYQLRPGTPELSADVAAFAEAYRLHPAAVIKAVGAAPSHIRDFADAFRFTRHGDR